jgi:hypothetical protein
MRQWIGAAALALAACGGSDGGGGDNAAGAANAAGGNSAAAAEAGGGSGATSGASGAAATMQPGEWEITVAVTGLEAPNMPAGMAMPPPQTNRTCLTPEQVAQAAGGVATGGLTNQTGCRTESNNVSAGRIDSTIQCEAPGGGRVRVVTAGQSTATTLEVEQRTEVSAQGTNMTTRSRVTGRRIGDCPG